jgi:hypothetical protein
VLHELRKLLFMAICTGLGSHILSGPHRRNMKREPSTNTFASVCPPASFPHPICLLPTPDISTTGQLLCWHSSVSMLPPSHTCAGCSNANYEKRPAQAKRLVAHTFSMAAHDIN